MTEKLTCGRLSTCELCSRCLLHLPLRRTVVCVHICYTPHVCTLRDRCWSDYASYTVRLKVNVGFWRWWHLEAWLA